ncbi:hypothetical protein TorRG33x02_040940 [Trema orientale]|uniref:Uncharacterized protein n=1 Tax=Trema orientale TaxID=63057 RepID=A0A2P5FR89_TREOI|nr:hypothetical protein TorRG33x02_040940 [Trema orientale]
MCFLINLKTSLMTRLFLSCDHGRANGARQFQAQHLWRIQAQNFVIQLQEKRERKQRNAKLGSSKENFLPSSKKMIWYLQWAKAFLDAETSA